MESGLFLDKSISSESALYLGLLILTKAVFGSDLLFKIIISASYAFFKLSEIEFIMVESISPYG